MSINQQISLRVTKDNVTTFIGGGETFAPDTWIDDGVNGAVVPANTYNQLLTISINYSKLVTLLLAANGPLSVSTNGTNAVQSLTISGGVTGGTFTVTYSAITSAAIPWNATASQVQTALQAMSSIGAGNVTVTGSAGGPWTLTFVGQLGVQVVTTVTASAGGLTGGTPAITPASVTTGVVPDQTFTINSGQATFWSLADGIFSNPITSNITKLNLTNTQGAAASFVIQAGMKN